MIETDSIDQNSSGNSNTKVFVLVFLMLCVLTGISFWVANSYLMENKVVGWTAMMLVSVAKALLVILFFMHLWWERAWKYILTIPALFMGILLVLLLVPDVGYRYLTYSKDRRENAPKPVVGELVEVSDATPKLD
jgi:cytochrome c oxidase subunit 4